MRIVLIGFGNVGQGFAEILRDKADDLAHRHAFYPRIVGVGTRSQGTLYHPDGLNPAHLLTASANGGLKAYPDDAGVVRGTDIPQMIATANADVLVEVSPSNLETGQPATDYCTQALQRGWHVVVANKGVVALHYPRLKALAREHGRQFRFEGTVMAGTPSLMLAIEALAGTTIKKARGILNGTTNYMLTHMEGGLSYADALADAQRLGYAETDPTADVGGWDAAGKALIIAQTVFGVDLKMSDLDVSGITHLTPTDIALAHESGETYKLIVTVTPTGGSVKATRIALDDPLASVKGATNAITFSTDLLGDVTLIGAGAGRVQTGYAILTDLLAIHRVS